MTNTTAPAPTSTVEMTRDPQSAAPTTVREAFFEVARRLGLTTVLGNPGSTEQTILKDFPEGRVRRSLIALPLTIRTATTCTAMEGASDETRDL